MKAHIIPQSYLKGFVDPNTPTRQEPYLHLYDFVEESWSCKAPKSALWQRDYYVLPGKEGDEQDALDHGPMSVIENQAAQLVQRKIVPKLSLTPEEKRDYAEFIGLMLGRVPAHREQMDRMMGDMLSLPWRLMARHNPDRYQRMADVYERDTGHKAPSVADWALFDEGQLTLRASQSDQLQGMAGVLDVASISINRMNWVFFHATPPKWFITSDNPVSLRVPDHPEWGFGLARKDIQLTFPVTRSISLLATWGLVSDAGEIFHIDLPAKIETAQGVTIDVGNEPLKAANMLQIGYCSRYIAAPSIEFPCAELIEHKEDIPAFFDFVATELEDEDAEVPNEE